MSEQDRVAVRLKLALVAGGLIAVGIGGLVVGRLSATAPPAPPPPVAAPPSAEANAVAPAAEEPVAEPVTLGRGDIIALAAAAAAAHASGQPAGTEPDSAIGRRFALRIAFGCNGPTAGPAAPARARPEGETPTELDLQPRQALEWSLNPATKVVRVSARPAAWTAWPLIAKVVSEPFDAVEGFWLPRPWTDSEACPRVADAAPIAIAASPPRQTVGLAQVYDAGDSRLGRRGSRPYEVVKKLSDAEAADLSRDFRLVLEGRIVGYPDHRAVRCASPSADERPVCLVGVAFDRVAIEDARSNELMGDWTR
jgi:hypothetical protein